MKLNGFLGGAKMRYLVVSGLSFSLNLVLTYGLVQGLRLSPILAYAISLVIVFLTNFHLVRYWVYPERVKDVSWSRQFIPFLSASFLFRGAEWISFAILVDGLGVYYLLSAVVVQVVAFVVKFIVYDRLIFNPRRR
ncbi:MAG: GtrA family protein [Verrucomicrobiota bacterium]